MAGFLAKILIISFQFKPTNSETVTFGNAIRLVRCEVELLKVNKIHINKTLILCFKFSTVSC